MRSTKFGTNKFRTNLSLITCYSMQQNARVTTSTVFELLRGKQQRGITLPPPRLGLKKSVQNLAFLFFTLKNENTRRPGFYTVLVTRVSSNFLQLKQLNKIKNTCEYCDLLELWSAWIGDPRYLDDWKIKKLKNSFEK